MGHLAKVAAATATFAIVHSLLASRTAKRAAARRLGPRARNALYRPFYLAQSVATFGLLVLYIRRVPARTVYEVRGRPALVMRAGQVAAVGYAVWAARQVGIGAMLGAPGVAAWLGGQQSIPPEPEAQGPAIATGGRMRATGPFRWSRHPLNLAPAAVFWLTPRMTDRLAAFSAASTVYLVLGSMHEETRLRAAYGAAYERYREAGVPFYVPRPGAVRTARAPRPERDGVPPARGPAAAADR